MISGYNSNLLTHLDGLKNLLVTKADPSACDNCQLPVYFDSYSQDSQVGEFVEGFTKILLRPVRLIRVGLISQHKWPTSHMLLVPDRLFQNDQRNKIIREEKLNGSAK